MIQYDAMRRIGVAISTTGQPHRMDLLVRCVQNWDAYLPNTASLFVTVDGDEENVADVARAVSPWTSSVLRVGQRLDERTLGQDPHRLGVAANKNTGLEALMDASHGVENLFLSDDDAWPLSFAAIHLHLGHLAHSMVCWGHHRRAQHRDTYADWSWPRGSVLYADREVVETVGGMIEAFGQGGHEHVEWSNRIHNAGLTPVRYPSPLVYTEYRYLGAARFWNCEDMPRPGEDISRLMARRRRISSIDRPPGYAAHIDQIMAAMDGSSQYVPYRAEANGRASATMSPLV